MAKDGAEEEERYQQRLERKKQAVGTKGMFYADQFSTDKKPMGRFGMGKSGVMWPVPEVVERGYSGDAGWGGRGRNTFSLSLRTRFFCPRAGGR